MATFTNVSGEDRDIPVYSLFVPAGTDFDVPDQDADGLRAQEWCTEKTTTPTVATPTPATIFVAPAAPSETVTAPVDAEQGVN